MMRHKKRATPMTAPRRSSRQQPKQLDAGIFQAEISSFGLRLAAEGKAAKTIRTYTEAVQWFAAACLMEHDRRTGPSAGLAPPHVPATPVPVLTVEQLTRLEQACPCLRITQRRDTAIVAVRTATRSRLSELPEL